MPAPQVTDRFNLTDRNQLQIDGAIYDRANLNATQTDLVIQCRNAGMWFTDIAHYFGFVSASQASAYYVRECRLRNIEPRLRARNTRVRVQDARLDQVPAWCSREFDAEFDLTFGVEVETVGLDYNASANAVADALSRQCRYEGYTHDNTHEWKVVRDGSLGNGAEVVSRVLEGADGLKELRTVLLSLKMAGARVSQRCGQHVHIGVENLTPKHRANIIWLHAMFQDVFLRAVKARRHDGTYCRKRGLPTARSLAESWNRNENQEGNGRYFHLNLQSYRRYGTFEIRSFQGSLNPLKTVNWIQLNLDFFHFCGLIAELITVDFDPYSSNPVIELDPRWSELQLELPLTTTCIKEGRKPVGSEVEAIWNEWQNSDKVIKNSAVREVMPRLIESN